MKETNFEAWRTKLTPEIAAELIYGEECPICPAVEECKEDERSCAETFLAWANDMNS